MVKIKYFVLLILLTPSHALAGTIFGDGNVRCGEVLSHFKENGLLMRSAMSWGNGWISARNMTLDADLDGEKYEFNSIRQFYINYCEDNPLDPFWHATEALYTDMLME